MKLFADLNRDYLTPTEEQAKALAWDYLRKGYCVTITETPLEWHITTYRVDRYPALEAAKCAGDEPPKEGA